MKQLHREMLQMSLKKKSIVSIHSNKGDIELVDVGYIDALNERECRIYVYTRYGMEDGLRVLLTDSIFLVEIEGLYEDRIAFYAQKGQHQLPSPKLPEVVSDNILLETLRQAQESRLMVSLKLPGEDAFYRGYVRSCDEENVCLGIHDGFGDADGVATVSTEDIRYVMCGSMEGQRVQFLAEHRDEFLRFRAELIR